jgi:hypothetical protein
MKAQEIKDIIYEELQIPQQIKVGEMKVSLLNMGKIVDKISNRLEKLVRQGVPSADEICEIIDKEVEVDTKLNEIFNTDAWWFSQKVGEKFNSHITRTLGRVKEKILSKFSD